jgi:ribosomal protein S18 acetylase RimI-like enzyme
VNTSAQLRPVDESLLIPSVVRSLTAICGQLVRGDAALGWVLPPTEAEIEGLLDELVTGSRAAGVLALDRDGQVDGVGYWRRYSRPTLATQADLEKLLVAPAAQGRGIGGLLLHTLIDSARAQGIEQLTLDFRGDNTTAEALYLRAGFREYGRLPDFVAPDGAGSPRREDQVLHVLDLR